VRRWVCLMREASTLMLYRLVYVYSSKERGDLRSDVVDYHGDSEAVLTSQDMLQKCCFTGALGYCKSRLWSEI
jgi:hypothetical protein